MAPCAQLPGRIIFCPTLGLGTGREMAPSRTTIHPHDAFRDYVDDGPSFHLSGCCCHEDSNALLAWLWVWVGRACTTMSNIYLSGALLTVMKRAAGCPAMLWAESDADADADGDDDDASWRVVPFDDTGETEGNVTLEQYILRSLVD